MARELRPMRLGETLSESFSIYSEHFATLYAMSAGLNVLSQIVALIVPYDLLPVAGVAGSVIVSLFVMSILPALMIDYIARVYQGEDASVAITLRAISPRLGSIIGVSILRTLIIMVAGGVVLAPLFALTRFVGGGAAVVYSFLAVAVGLVATVWLAFAMHVTVAEGKRAGAAIKRSVALTKGYRGRILGYTIVTGIITNVVTRIANAIIGALPLGESVQAVLTGLASALVSPFTAGVSILLYFTVRIEKEGFDLEYIAERFPSGHGGDHSPE